MDKELKKIDAYWRAANYLSVGQLYLLDNPLLKRKLSFKDIKPKVVGHWGTTPGQNFIYVHLNRVIKKYDLNMIYISGPGHGGQAVVANTYLEGTYSEVYPSITRDEAGLRKLFKQFSFPGGVSSHVAPETPGSINEGGELGYSLAHAYGAVLDNPDLIAACVIGDGELETGPLQASLQINKIINPKTDGTVLPILHLNGYKISNPTIFSRITDMELDDYFRGSGYLPYYVEGDDPKYMHKKMAEVLDEVIEKIQDIKYKKSNKRPRWPIIILRTPKGWTGPKEVEGKKVEGTFRSHQVPINVVNDQVESIETTVGAVFKVKSVILATGTYLKGKIFMGDFSQESGPDGVFPANKLSECLKELGIENIECVYYCGKNNSNESLFKCLKCGSVWNAQVGNVLGKNHRTGCPICRESKGEQRIKQVLDKYNIDYIRQYKFDDCKNKHRLPFDFCCIIDNKIYLIEYDGEQHFKAVNFRGTSDENAMRTHTGTVKNDKIKKLSLN